MTDVMKGEESTSYETKVLSTLLAERVSQAKSVEEAYKSIVRAASSEGVTLPTYLEQSIYTKLEEGLSYEFR